jgi:hypothetical protein
MSEDATEYRSERKTRSRKQFDPSKANSETPMRLRWLSQYLNIGEQLIYQAIEQGYRIRYPRIGMTTPAHFLAWCEQDTGEPASSYDLARMEREEANIMSSTRAGKPSLEPRQCRRPRAASKSDEPQYSRD